MTKRFKFSLERILAIRRLEERMRKNLFAQAQMALFRAEEAKLRAEKERDECDAQLGKLRVINPMPVLECVQMESFLEDIKNTIIRRIKVIEARKLDVEKTRQEYLAASTRRKALERIRATRKQKYQQEVKAEQAKRFDAIAVERAYFRSLQEEEEKS